MSDYMIQKADNQIEAGLTERENLIKQLAEKTKELESALEVLRFYADANNWQNWHGDLDHLTAIISKDKEDEYSVCGRKAREFLKKYEEKK